MTKPREAVRAGVGTLTDTAGTVRRKRPFLDHIIRAYGRYTADGGDRLAASATYFAFLSFFPLVALAFAVTGFVVDAYPDAQASLTRQINDYLPGLADRLDVASIGNAKVGVGLIGLAGLLLAGLAWIDALRDAIRLVWHQSVDVGNLVMRRLRDITVLAGLGVTLLASLVVTSLSTSATGSFLDWIGLAGSSAAAWVTGILALLVALAIDTAVFLYLFWRLPKKTDRRRSVRGAVLGAIGLELLKIVGTWLVGQTTGNPVYGTFAVIVGLLIWINIVMRWTLFVAAWTVTAPFDSDVFPSGSAGKSTDPDATAQAPDDGPADPTAADQGRSEAASSPVPASVPASSPPQPSAPSGPRSSQPGVERPTESVRAAAARTSPADPASPAAAASPPTPAAPAPAYRPNGSPEPDASREPASQSGSSSSGGPAGKTPEITVPFWSRRRGLRRRTVSSGTPNSPG